MGSVTEFAKKPSPKPATKEELADKVAGFTFSRRPRAERIASILFEVLKKLGGPLENGQVDGPDDLMEIAKALEPYAFKDFAVRFGKLDDAAPTHRI